MKPTNVTRLLDSRGIKYTPLVLSSEKLSALQVAQILGVSPNQVYKTIVVLRIERGKPILALVPAPYEVDLKALARHLSEKNVHLPTEREAEKLTGLLAGGISPLALLQRGFQVVLDSSTGQHAEIIISGGQRGLMIQLPTHELVKLTNATLADIARVFV